MKLQYVPLLKVQRELYEIPRETERFRTYLATMIDPETGDLNFPLVSMNPMGKDHVPALLDRYLELDADGAAERAVIEAAGRLEKEPGDFRVTVVLADDARGGWTNRFTTEYSHRFESKPYLRRGWLTGLLWTSEEPSARAAQEEALMAVYRATYIRQHGFASTLGEMIAQEGYAVVRAGCTCPVLEDDDLAYTREIITPLLDTRDHPTIMACLFGDEAARSLGYRPIGLSARAGFAVCRVGGVTV